MELQIDERKIEPDIMVIQLSGNLALGRESQRIEAMVEEYSKSGGRRLILDMSGVEHIDSAGIGIIGLAAGAMKQAGGTLAVVAVEGRVLQMLKMTQMNQIVTVCASAEEAVRAV